MSIRTYFYKVVRTTLVIFLLLSLGGTVSYFVIFHWYVKKQLPPVQDLKEIELQVPLQIYSQDNFLIGEFGEVRRLPIPIKDIPKLLIHAVLAAEDHRFYEHPGIDFSSLIRATVNLIKTGEIQQGGSTITMQVARNAFLESRERTFERKFKEILLAWQIEQKWTKDEIMELYLNKIFLGHRAYGIGAAAQVYYDKKIDNLSLAQYAMLAGLPKAPSANNPITNPKRAKERRNYILKRMEELNYITKEQYDTAEKAPITAQLRKSPIKLEARYIAEMVRAYMVDKFGEAAYTKGYRVITTVNSQWQKVANDALRDALFGYDERHGYRGILDHITLAQGAKEADFNKILQQQRYPEYGDLVPSIVLNVAGKTAKAYNQSAKTFDIAWQDLMWARSYVSDNKRGSAPRNASSLLKRGDIVLVRTVAGRWRLAEVPQVEGALVSLNPDNGATLALVGGFDFFQSKFNRAIQAERQPGSSFKPFIYSAALERGYTPASVINDAPLVFNVDGKVWRPHNYSGKSYGPTSLRKGLAYSRNLVSVRLLNNIGVPYTVDYLTKFGFDKEKIPKNLTIALGTGDVTPWQMAKAYAVFANGGYLLEPYFIERIENAENEVICKAYPLTVCHENCPKTNLEVTKTAVITAPPVLTPKVEKVCPEPLIQATTADLEIKPRYALQTVSPRNAWIMTSLLKDVIQYGTAKQARQLNRTDVAGKTGTTNDAFDAWFVGYTPDVVTATWIGFDQPRSLGYSETGGKSALPMWITFMQEALKGKPVRNLPMPTGVTAARIDPASGLLTDTKNPKAKFETFYSETVPKKRKTHSLKQRPTTKLRPRPRQKDKPIKRDSPVPEQLF